MIVLLLAPQGDDRVAAASFLASLGHEVVAQLPGSAPPDALVRERVDAIVLDLAGGQDALKFLRRRAAGKHAVPIVCIADRRRLDASAEALRLGAADIIGRPISSDSIQAALGNARELATIAGTPQPEPVAESTPDGLFGASPAMREVLTLSRKVAASRCAVLIVGERGTGREMVARTIHADSAYASLPFVKVACAGANEAEVCGVFERSQPHATIFLENLGELPVELQVCVEEHLRSVASDAEPGFHDVDHRTHAPLRIIAGAHPRLWDWVDRGLVRRELVEALAIVRIDLPPLRQRKEDIPLLAMHFLKAACRDNAVPPKTFSRPALTLLTALPWPGNATELRALCERLAVLVTRGVVLLEDVLDNIRFDGAEALGRRRETLKLAREQFEKDFITSALQHHRGRMGAAAQELGIERTNLYRKIRALNVRWTGEPD